MKDVKTLLRAFVRVRLSIPNARLRIYGGTPPGNEGYRNECLDLRDKLGLEESVAFEGRVRSIADAYLSGDVVVATSISEGFPYAVLEAMASGRAMIATDVGGVSEAIDDAGILVPPQDESQPRRRLHQVARQPGASSGTRQRWPRASAVAIHGRVEQRTLRRAVRRPGRRGPWIERGSIMSARMPVTVMESELDAADVHGWLERVIDGDDVSLIGSSPLATVCSSAVDPLEIAVALEVAGISHAVATNRYNRADVFALARTLWSRLPLRPALDQPPTLPRPGDRRDLARGLLYILPAVMLLALTKALDVELAKWVLPVAISWGWGLGQVAAFAGYRIQGAGMPYEAIIMVRVLAGAAVSTWLVSTLATMVAGGGGADVGATTALVTYMAASAILLVRAEERWLALLLLPGALASAYVLARSNGSVFSRSAAVVVIGGSFFAVLCRASRQLRLRKSQSGRFGSRDVLAGSGHLLHGVICGLAVSLVVIRTGHASAENNFGRMLLPVPLLAALGAMEWQLHTFRARMARLLNSLGSIKQFRGWRGGCSTARSSSASWQSSRRRSV